MQVVSKSMCQHIELIISYLNQLKEKRPLEHGTIESTIPALMQKLVIFYQFLYFQPDNVHILDEKVVMENHVRSESEWGIADPPALQQLIVNVGKSEMVDHRAKLMIINKVSLFLIFICRSFFRDLSRNFCDFCLQCIEGVEAIF